MPRRKVIQQHAEPMEVEKEPVDTSPQPPLVNNQSTPQASSPKPIEPTPQQSPVTSMSSPPPQTSPVPPQTAASTPPYLNPTSPNTSVDSLVATKNAEISSLCLELEGLLRQMPSDLLRGASDAPAILSAFQGLPESTDDTIQFLSSPAVQPATQPTLSTPILPQIPDVPKKFHRHRKGHHSPALIASQSPPVAVQATSPPESWLRVSIPLVQTENQATKGSTSADSGRDCVIELESSDMDMFGLTPLRDQRELVTCTHCSRVILMSKFAFHLAQCNKVAELKKKMEENKKSPANSAAQTQSNAPQPQSQEKPLQDIKKHSHHKAESSTSHHTHKSSQAKQSTSQPSQQRHRRHHQSSSHSKQDSSSHSVNRKRKHDHYIEGLRKYKNVFEDPFVSALYSAVQSANPVPLATFIFSRPNKIRRLIQHSQLMAHSVNVSRTSHAVLSYANEVQKNVGQSNIIKARRSVSSNSLNFSIGATTPGQPQAPQATVKPGGFNSQILVQPTGGMLQSGQGLLDVTGKLTQPLMPSGMNSRIMQPGLANIQTVKKPQQPMLLQPGQVVRRL